MNTIVLDHPKQTIHFRYSHLGPLSPRDMTPVFSNPKQQKNLPHCPPKLEPRSSSFSNALKKEQLHPLYFLNSFSLTWMEVLLTPDLIFSSFPEPCSSFPFKTDSTITFSRKRPRSDCSLFLLLQGFSDAHQGMLQFLLGFTQCSPYVF